MFSIDGKVLGISQVTRTNHKGHSIACLNCGAVNKYSWDGCTNCGEKKGFSKLCLKCNSKLVSTNVEYTAVNSLGVSITKSYPAEQCSSCSHVYIFTTFPNRLDEDIRKAPLGFELVPELGISTKGFIELFVDGGRDYDQLPTIKRTYQGVTVRFGHQSRLFQNWLYHITSYDSSDYGHDLSPTVQIRPSPPYTNKQRRAIHLALAKLRVELETPLNFWSVHFGKTFPEEREEIIKELIPLLINWNLDKERKALMLINELGNNVHPGPFINAFRLLEFILERYIDQDIEKACWNRSISNQELLTLAKSYGLELKIKLRRRVEALTATPTDILREIWRITQPGKGYNQIEVFAEIAKYRNVSVHAPLSSTEEIPLPWEVPPYEYFTNKLLKLIGFIIKHNL